MEVLFTCSMSHCMYYFANYHTMYIYRMFTPVVVCRIKTKTTKKRSHIVFFDYDDDVRKYGTTTTTAYICFIVSIIIIVFKSDITL